ncbi:MAG: caspase family protein [Pseudomonadota bacterium]
MSVDTPARVRAEKVGVRRDFIAGVFARLAGALVLLCAATLVHAAEGKSLRGVALIIGNGAYEHLAALTNPPDDARAVEDLFDQLGFETTSVRDADARKLRRAVERFVEDAEGADAAVVYYAGHGIEAGGENWLIPVDADLSSLDDAGETLVPLTTLMRDLGKVAPLTIVLLDACRDNPFPPGTTVRPSPDAAPQPVSASGLGETRSVARFGAKASGEVQPEDGFGALIGFAAEPGKVALDGDAGANSPYAAAVLRHVSAMTGEEFGTVMRMVAEEVYLKTGGRQRPWINESLRRLLYFGSAPDPVEGEEGEILAERRQLLLTIAALPGQDRQQVEQAAAARGVPMDALYGMLRALGQEIPKDPKALQEMLRSQAETLEELMAERASLKSADPEIARLSGLADHALAEGALATAIALHGQAKQRVGVLEKTVASAEEDALARRREFASVFARSAEANALAFDHLAAAADYAKAFEQVERRDDRLAWTYKHAQMMSLARRGRFMGDRAAYEKALAAGDQALRIADYLGDLDLKLRTRNDIGLTLRRLGEREPGTESLDRAVSLLREALASADRDADPVLWGEMQQTFGKALVRIGERRSDPQPLTEAVTAFENALSTRSPDKSAEAWAESQHVLGAALATLGVRDRDTARLERSVDAFKAALTVRSPQLSEIDWSNTLSALGAAYAFLGERRADPQMLADAVACFRQALTVIRRDRMPLEWADIQSNLGASLIRVGELGGGRAPIEEAVGAFHASLSELTFERGPAAWAETQNNLGAALAWLANDREDVDLYRKSIDAYRTAQKVQTFEAMPVAWAQSQYNIGTTSGMLGRATRDVATLDRSAAALRDTLQVYSHDKMPFEWMRTHYELGRTLFALGRLKNDREAMLAAARAFETSLEGSSPKESRHQWTIGYDYLGQIYLELAEKRSDAAAARKAIGAYEAVLRGVDIEKDRGDLVEAHGGLAQSWLTLGLIEKDADAMRKARATFETAVGFTDQATDPDRWINARDGLAGALAELGILTRNPDNLKEARGIVASLRDFVRSLGIDRHEDYFRDRLATIDRFIAEVK